MTPQYWPGQMPASPSQLPDGEKAPTAQDKHGPVAPSPPQNLQQIITQSSDGKEDPFSLQIHTHPSCENAAIRAIISAESQVAVGAETVRFDLKPGKVFLFNKETEERIRF